MTSSIEWAEAVYLAATVEADLLRAEWHRQHGVLVGIERQLGRANLARADAQAKLWALQERLAK